MPEANQTFSERFCDKMLCFYNEIHSEIWDINFKGYPELIQYMLLSVRYL